MRLHTRAFLALMSLVFVTGCATTPSQAALDNDDIDHRKVGAIERVAGERGVKVYWLNYPRKEEI
jgi:hypothetical protein